MVAALTFDLTQKVIDGRPHRAMRIQCCRCSRSETVLMNMMAYGAGSHDKEERMAARKFEKLGWGVGSRRHFCPEHWKKPRVEIVSVTEQEKPEMSEGKVVAIAPRKMEREDRRIIFEKLNDVYVNEKEGYTSPWTDESVAKDLGVPRAWVAQIRDENFGPVASNADIDQAIIVARELAEQMKKHGEIGEKLCGAADAMLKRLDTIIKAVGCRA